MLWFVWRRCTEEARAPNELGTGLHKHSGGNNNSSHNHLNVFWNVERWEAGMNAILYIKANMVSVRLSVATKTIRGPETSEVFKTFEDLNRSGHNLR